MATNNFTSTGGGGASGGINLSTLGSGGFRLSPFSNTHEFANHFVQNVENRLGGKLAAISTLAKTDPAAAQQQLGAAWAEFLRDSYAFMSREDMGEKVKARTAVLQAMKNPGLLNTVEALWLETGGAGGFTGFNEYVASQDSSIGGLLMELLPNVAQVILSGLDRKTPTDLIDKPGAPTTQGPDGGGDSDWFDKYIKPFLPLAVQTGLELWGASSAAKSAKEAAQIQADAAKDAQRLQKEMFETTRADLAPWRRAGASSLQALSYGLGLPDPMSDTGARFASPPMTLAGVGAAPTDPNNPNNRPHPNLPDLNAIAARYQQRGV